VFSCLSAKKEKENVHLTNKNPLNLNLFALKNLKVYYCIAKIEEESIPIKLYYCLKLSFVFRKRENDFLPD
jgi:hypothetical protein